MCIEDQPGGARGRVCFTKPFTRAWERLQQTREISESVITLAGLQKKPNMLPGAHLCSARWCFLLFSTASLITELALHSTLI